MHPGMGEAQALDHVGELDVDAEVVGVELQRVAGLETGALVDRHAEHGDVALQLELPVPVTRGIGREGNHRIRGRTSSVKRTNDSWLSGAQRR